MKVFLSLLVVFLANVRVCALAFLGGTMQFGARFKACRKSAGLKQTAAAKLIGISQASISEYENNKSLPPASTIVAMAKVYGVSTDYLLGMTDEKE